MAKDSFWQNHRINQQEPATTASTRGIPVKPEGAVVNPGGAFMGPHSVSVPVEAETPGIKERATQVRSARTKLADVRRTRRALGASDESAEDAAQKDVEVAESGYARQANESTRRVAKRKV